MELITTRSLYTTHIPTGTAREAGRAPSHDGEYLTDWWDQESRRWILLDNAGIITTSEGDPIPDELDEACAGELAALAQAIEHGEAAPIEPIPAGTIIQPGTETARLMIAWGWAQPA